MQTSSLTARIAHTVARINQRLTENKSAVKTYASEKTAARVMHETAEKLAAYWEVETVTCEVVQIANGRFTPVFDLNDLVTRGRGGYLGAHLDGFYTISTDIMAA